MHSDALVQIHESFESLEHIVSITRLRYGEVKWSGNTFRKDPNLLHGEVNGTPISLKKNKQTGIRTISSNGTYREKQFSILHWSALVDYINKEGITVLYDDDDIHSFVAPWSERSAFCFNSKLSTLLSYPASFHVSFEVSPSLGIEDSSLNLGDILSPNGKFIIGYVSENGLADLIVEPNIESSAQESAKLHHIDGDGDRLYCVANSHFINSFEDRGYSKQETIDKYCQESNRN